MDRLRSRVAGLLLCLTPFAASAAAPDSSWDWAVAPYVWAASIGTDIRTYTPPTNASTDTAFPDVVDTLDGVFQVHGEGQGDAFGAFADFTYFGLADDTQRRFQRTESDLDMRLIEVAAVWSPGQTRFTGLETFAGARVIDLDYARAVPARQPGVRAAFDRQGRNLLRLHGRRALHVGVLGPLVPHLARRRLVGRHRGHLERERARPIPHRQRQLGVRLPLSSMPISRTAATR